MQRKRSVHTPKGMCKDMSDSKLGAEYYIDALNIRLTATDDNTLLSITNARGNKKVELTQDIKGSFVGHAVLNDYVVIFTTSTHYTPTAVNTDRIYRIDTSNKDSEGRFSTILLASGNFGFNTKYPVDTLPMYEKDDVQKVYWIDGKNQPRYINIADKIESGVVIPRTDVEENSSRDTEFDFVATLNLEEEVTITRNETTIGLISAGAIQYVFTYYNVYGAETNIFYQSSLNYISYNDRGASPEDTTVSASFSIKIENPDSNFKYVRIYAIHRTSLNATPSVRRVIDLPVPSADEEDRVIYYTDDGTVGETVDPSLLLYIGGKTIVPQTMDFKDNVLFFGNYQEKGSIIPQEVKDSCKNITIKFGSKEDTFDMGEDSDYYSYKSGLTENLSKISTFKYLEWYRFGIQAQKNTGEWSEPIFIKDAQNDQHISYDTSNIKNVGATATLNSETIQILKNSGYVKVRPLIVYPSITDRECICQGVVSPTVFNVEDRKSNSPWSQSSWFFRPNSPWQGTNPGSAQNVDTIYLPMRRDINTDTWSNFKVGDTVTLHYYNDEGVASACTLKIHGIADDVILGGSADEDKYKYSVFAVSVVDKSGPSGSTPNVVDLTGYSKAYKDNKYANYIDDSNAQVLGYTVFRYTGNMAAADARISEAVLPGEGSNARMVWSNAYTYIDSTYSWCAINDPLVINSESANTFTLSASIKTTTEESTVTGTIPEFRHWQPLASSMHPNGEIQCNFISTGCLKSSWEKMVDKDKSTDEEKYAANFTEQIIDITNESTKDSTAYVDTFSDIFFVDQSVVTFHSPDIEFDTNTRNIDNSLLKMRIVGYVPITSNISDVDIQTSSIQLNYRNTTALPRGFWHETVASRGIGGVGSLNSVPLWFDDEYYGSTASEQTDKNEKQFTTAFVTYPWHRNGSLNNQDSKDKDNYRSAMLKRKVMSNLRYSYQTQFFNVLKGDTVEDKYNYDLAGISLFDSNEIINTRIKGSITNTINYYGNVDKIVTSPRVFRINKDHQVTGYPIFKTSRFQAGGGSLQAYHNAFIKSTFQQITDHGNNDVSSVEKQQRFGSDPVQIKYKSTTHAVLSLKSVNNTTCRILPTANDINGKELNKENGKSVIPYWSSKAITISQDVLDCKMNRGWLWLVELYNDSIDPKSRFGGTSDDAIENNTWVPCGSAKFLSDKDSLTLEYTEGDTFFQRYDCLKTYPYTTEDSNSIVDILSFMCETRVNIDGRYDRNRGQNSNLQMSPTNFNLLNHVYTQGNNFFSYRTLDKTMFNVDTYRNYITWSKKKIAGEETDTWTNVTLANVLDLDGDKGDINAIKRYNDNLFAFQDKALSQILYNERTQVSTTSGVPIELANSDKVSGKRYISETVGCRNKWSIADSPYGLYFMDANSSSIYLFNGKLESLTDKFGFNSWARKAINTEIWNTTFNTFRTFYDNINKDVYFVGKESALNYSESLQQFTSFISYENTPAMFNVGNKFYAFKDNNLYEQGSGDYGVFYGISKPYYITFLDNQEFTNDKTYTNLEFRAVVNPDIDEATKLFNIPFNRLKAKTDYQEGTAEFTAQSSTNYNKYPNMIRKFRAWRLDIPRHIWTNASGVKKRDRMRNPWIYLTLEKDAIAGSPQNKMEMHDLIVDYYI